jgi:hypothetical protein
MTVENNTFTVRELLDEGRDIRTPGLSKKNKIPNNIVQYINLGFSAII